MKHVAHSVELKDSQIDDPLWSDMITLIKEKVVPYQWKALNDDIPDADPSYAINNFKIAAGEKKGEFGGMVFQDSDLAKWLEAVAYLLEISPDPELEAIADEAISLIGKAQQPDGYLNTYFTIKEPDKKWTNLTECHELYCAGHMIEAAVAYYKATGKRDFLDIVCRLADHIDTVFGNEPGKIKGYDGHQEIELALMKLYEVTQNDAYFKLSRFFIDERGAEPSFFKEEWENAGKITHFPGEPMALNPEYNQAHAPVREQSDAVGHAVRLVYMCAGMADVAAETGDESLLDACRRLWRSIVSKRMYITGGIGSQVHGEAFSTDYDLPNDTAYAETCASIGLIFFAHRMLKIEEKSEYGDVLERALYNTVAAGMALDGQSFFYVNPLEVDPAKTASNGKYRHVEPVRKKWFSCACCPPNVARLLASLGEYIYTVKHDTVYTHLYIGGNAETQVDGRKVKFNQTSHYAADGNVRFTVNPEEPSTFTMAFRLPDWAGGAVQFTINGTSFTDGKSENGYFFISREWSEGDVIDINFQMDILKLSGNPRVTEVLGKTTVQRGPFVYCAEEEDNGSHVHQILASKASDWRMESDNNLLNGLPVIKASGFKEAEWPEEAGLYSYNKKPQHSPHELVLIPYFAWANRSKGNMAVWLR